MGDASTSDLGSSVEPTGNPLVAAYTVNVVAGAEVHVEFGLDKTYGRTTSTRPAPEGGGPVTTLVAGMLPNQTYYMRAVIRRPDGWTVTDVPQTFQTGALPTNIQLPTLKVTNTPGLSPSPGVELMNIIQPDMISVIADLSGNVIWYYDNASDASWQGYAFPLKFRPNGNLLASITNMYTKAYDTQPQSVLREIDLAGNTIVTPQGPRELYLADLNAQLKNVPTSKNSIVVANAYSHDFVELPNGHVILIVLETKLCRLGTEEAVLIGDALVDLDENFNAVWTWSAFDWLDVQRRPGPFRPPDPSDVWTHCNAIVLGPDGNLVLSVRDQNWILKINYQGGSGDGSILWTLGYQGSFTWSGDTPDWFAAQHYPHILAVDGRHITRLAVFDNGDDRVGTRDLYSRGAVFAIDETALTAQLAWQFKPGAYSWWGGNTVSPAPGRMEIAMSEPCAVNTVPPAKHDLPSHILEVTTDAPPVVVWKMESSPGAVYRSYRIPSLYPGVTWNGQ